jgi:CDP-diacylglycerol--serine O-phosphatidyltransferase
MHAHKEILEPEFPRRAFYLLPNLFTTAALFAGFYACVQAVNGRFDQSAIAIFIAMVLDGLDGRVARLTNTQSAFGAEYDSLSDMIAFGAAPALLAYEWALKDMGIAGWAAAFTYCAGAALRLARFNTNLKVIGKRYFQGLPSPAAAALIAGFVWAALDNGSTGEDAQWYAFVLTVFAGLTMISSLPFYSGKDINMRRGGLTIALVVLFMLSQYKADRAPGALFALFFCYSLAGYAHAAWRWVHR